MLPPWLVTDAHGCFLGAQNGPQIRCERRVRATKFRQGLVPWSCFCCLADDCALARLGSAKPISWTRPRTPRSIGRVRKVAPIDGKAAASDTLSETGFETLKLSDPVVDASHPFARKARPVAASRDPIGWQLGELRADLLKGETEPLREHDKCNPAQHGSRKTAMSGACSLGCDQAPLLVEAQRRGCDSASPGHLADRQHGIHPVNGAQFLLDFKFTLTCSQ